MRRIVGRRPRAAPKRVTRRIVGRRLRAAPARSSMVAARRSIRVAAMQWCALLYSAAISAASRPCSPALIYIRQNGLAACKTLASRRTSRKGTARSSIKHEPSRRVFSLSKSWTVSASNSSSRPSSEAHFVDVSPHARQQEAHGLTQGSLQDARAASRTRTDRRRPQKQEVCVLGSPSPA